MRRARVVRRLQQRAAAACAAAAEQLHHPVQHDDGRGARRAQRAQQRDGGRCRQRLYGRQLLHAHVKHRRAHLRSLQRVQRLRHALLRQPAARPDGLLRHMQPAGRSLRLRLRRPEPGGHAPAVVRHRRGVLAVRRQHDDHQRAAGHFPEPARPRRGAHWFYVAPRQVHQPVLVQRHALAAAAQPGAKQRVR